MVFSSLNFLFLFFPAVLAVYFLVPFRAKNAVLLLASIFFYAWGEPVYVILMMLNILLNYVTGLQMEAASDRRKRKFQLAAGVAVNLLLLGFFKYSGFLVGIIGNITGITIAWKEPGLPIGISFYTFQALSYVIDVYRRRVRVQHNLVDFAAYITMFPQLVAGPIVTYSQIETQLTSRKITLAGCGAGLERLILGLSKKVILANNLGAMHTQIQAMTDRSVLLAWLGAVAYTLQIYFDFSGYSDMAIGMGKILGFQFPENFDFPYLADSITSFWRKWHMTLSGWFRDYLYIPLGGNRRGAARHILNLMIVWFLTGLWHGAGWNFVLWGVYYGILLVLEKYILDPLLSKAPGVIRHIYTLFLVNLGWVLFSNTQFGQMTAYLGDMFGAGTGGFADSAFLYYLKSNLILLILSIIACSPVLRKLLNRISRRSSIAAAVICIVLFLVCTAFLVYGSYNPFLYFRF